MKLPQSARELIEAGAHAHLVTLNPDGSPHVTIVWAGLDGSDIVVGHLPENRKVKNIRRDERVAVSFESDQLSSMELIQYLVVYGRASIEAGGGAELLQKLARTYIGPGVKFPPMDDPPSGYVTRIKVDAFTGVGPWTGRSV